MGFRSLTLCMEVKSDVPPAFATAIPAMFEALLDVFAPLEVSILVDDRWTEIERFDPARRFETSPLWCDEELTRDPINRCAPTLGTDVVAELHDRLAGITPKKFFVAADGAVLHRAPGTDAPAWYGRWRGAGLWELAHVSFTWTDDPWRGIEMRCPLGGYPFTPIRPLVKGRLVEGDPALAAENRALWLPSLCKLRAALGFDREEVAWHTDGDYDDDELPNHWLPALDAS